MPIRNDRVIHNTEDKGWWCHHGLHLERSFVELCSRHLRLTAMENPEKSHNPYAPDLLVEGRLADLKVQNTPFFVSARYGLNPRRTVTFNRKDYERYSRLYPQIDIYYWVDWTQTESRFGRVDYLAGIYRLPFAQLAKLIEASAPEHFYAHRMHDTQGNAKSSFLLDLDHFETLLERDTITAPQIGQG
ncbi:hypothetical protein K5Q02_02005 [Pseudomonas sp. MM211]|uniref:hypothetical protein n=1 Tax=Pseudomonas sp. MM211 TaxID=2866808 RepID=UPI001CECD207|nr:hypothetical protein [Pseudomonas sp. MM211]UCJ17192.1 hypothetical protein K5Q02_02005 [Pseudomonas sp. MM211]